MGAKYAINIIDGRVIPATEETLRQPDYRALSSKTALDIRDGNITPKTVIWQIQRRESVHGRPAAEVEGLRPDNTRKFVFPKDEEVSGGDGGFVADTGDGADAEATQDSGAGDSGGDGTGPGETLELMTVAQLAGIAAQMGIPVKGMRKSEVIAHIRAERGGGDNGE